MSKVLIDTEILQKLLIESEYYRAIRTSVTSDEWADYFGEALSTYVFPLDEDGKFLKATMEPNNVYDYTFDDFLRWNADHEIEEYKERTKETFELFTNGLTNAITEKVFYKDRPPRRHFCPHLT